MDIEEEARKLAQEKENELLSLKEGQNFDNSVNLPSVNLNKVDLPSPEVEGISNITKETQFGKAVDDAKINILKEASAEDTSFVKELKNELKEAAKKSAQLENDKQELEKKNIELYQSFIDTKKELEEQKQNENKWINKQKAREYHYNGLKDIMLFVHISNPMCIPLMYLIALLVAPVYLIWTLILCPIGTLIAGTKDQERPKLVKGAIYTILLITLILGVAFGVYALIHYVFMWF